MSKKKQEKYLSYEKQERVETDADGKCTKFCQKHFFTMNPLKNDLYHQNPFQVDYCPRYSEDSQQLEQIIPFFLNDGQPHFPTFTINTQKGQLRNNQQRYISDHQFQKLEALKKQTDLLEPKPGRQSKYCGVCQNNYEDYLTHIKSEEHISFFRNNSICRDLLKVCALYKDERSKEKQNDNSKTMISELQICQIRQEQEIIIIDPANEYPKKFYNNQLVIGSSGSEENKENYQTKHNIIPNNSKIKGNSSNHQIQTEQEIVNLVFDDQKILGNNQDARCVSPFYLEVQQVQTSIFDSNQTNPQKRLNNDRFKNFIEQKEKICQSETKMSEKTNESFPVIIDLTSAGEERPQKIKEKDSNYLIDFNVSVQNFGGKLQELYQKIDGFDEEQFG